jgi:hypothetical protein
VLVGLPSGLNTSQKDGVGAGRCTQSELVEGESLTTSSENALLGTTGESKGGNGKLGDFGQTDVISDGADLNDDFRVAVRGVGGLLGDS